MGALVHLICIAVASFAVLAQPAGAQGTNTTLPLTYSTQVFHEDGNQTCLSEEQKETARIWIKNAAKRLLQQSVVSLPQTFSCGGSTGWRRVAYLDMSDPSEHCPSVWQEITTPHRVCGRRSTGVGSCEGLTYSTGSAQYNQVCGRIIGYTRLEFQGLLLVLISQSTLLMLMELVSHMALPANTSGPLLLGIMNSRLQGLAYVLLGAPMKTIFPHL